MSKKLVQFVQMRRGGNCNITHAADTVSLRTLGKGLGEKPNKKRKARQKAKD
jgi:hypothetical protein